MLKSDSRARSAVGRTASDFGAASRLPRNDPPTIRIGAYRLPEGRGLEGPLAGRSLRGRSARGRSLHDGRLLPSSSRRGAPERDRSVLRSVRSSPDFSSGFLVTGRAPGAIQTCAVRERVLSSRPPRLSRPSRSPFGLKPVRSPSRAGFAPRGPLSSPSGRRSRNGLSPSPAPRGLSKRDPSLRSKRLSPDLAPAGAAGRRSS